MQVDEPSWRRLLMCQDGVVSRAQALRAGWSADAVAHRLRRGRWQVLVPGVLLTVSGAPSDRQRLRAALLHAGPEAALTGSVACRLHGLERAEGGTTVDVASPSRYARRSWGYVRVRPTTRATYVVLLDGLSAVPAARAVTDACLELTVLDDVRALVAEAVQRRRTTPEALLVELRRAPVRHSRLLRTALAEVAEGARSPAEGRLLQAMRRCRALPAYLLNVDVHDRDGRWLARPDIVFHLQRLIVEVDGMRWHVSPERWVGDLERHTRLEAAGWRVLRYPAARVLADADGVVAELLLALDLPLAS
jgi:hypothetical protein